MFNFILIDFTPMTNKSAIITKILFIIIMNLAFLLPIAYFLAESITETILYFVGGYSLINVVAIQFKRIPANLAFYLFEKKTMILFFSNTLYDNKFPTYNESIPGDKWIDRVLTDTSLSCEQRLAASELGMIMSSIIGQSSLSNAEKKIVDAFSVAIENHNKL